MEMPKRDEGRGVLIPVLTTTIVLIAFALTLGSSASAEMLQGPESPTSVREEPRTEDSQTRVEEAPGNVSMSEQDVERFMDDYVPNQLEKGKIPGATVSVVRDGEVLFAKGYGLADVEGERRVVADETLFRIASMSKPFTATAVMQLAEKGKVDLDTDVNEYLDDMEIPDTYPGQPVTLRHLLTHTAGFEEHATGFMSRTSDDLPPLGEYLSENPPERVRPPGEVTSYSNYGMSLAGHVVEEVSGQTYDRYLEENVFGPLGMDGSTAAQPPAPGLRERLSTGYEAQEGEPVAGPFEYVDDAPAGAVSTTSTDMARFMISHLNDGSYGGGRILQTDTAREMHEEQFVNAPGLRDGMGVGFYEQSINGERTIQHAGNLMRFHGLLTLVPERNVGVFVAYNSYGQGGNFAEYELTDAFFDRFSPQEERPATIEPSASDAEENGERFAGSYRTTRSNETGFEKVTTLLTGARVAANTDGSITTHGGLLSRDFEKTERRWVRMGPEDAGANAPVTFRAEDGDELIAFREVGDTTYLVSEADPTSAYSKLPFYANPRLHLGLAFGSMAVIVISSLAWAVGAIVSWWREKWSRRLYGKAAGERQVNRSAGRARLLAYAVALLAPLFAVGMAAIFSKPEAAIGYGASPFLIGVLTLPVLISVASVGVLVHTALAWKRGYWSTVGRIHYSLVALSTVVFVALCVYYNLIGYRF